MGPELRRFAADEGCSFTYIPPRAPNFGGLWEAAVKSAKHNIVRVIGNALLTAEELATLLAEVEAILNSRPLVPLSQDDEALTPAHLLIGCSLRALPPKKVPVDPFWRQWSKVYLTGLQERNKWLHPKRNMQLNDLVLVHEDNVPPQQWVLGTSSQRPKGKTASVPYHVSLRMLKNAGTQFGKRITPLYRYPLKERQANITNFNDATSTPLTICVAADVSLCRHLGY
ncbi:uncharacterized protein LOC126765573 [Bactrocera neohumeralis]|uniref:uncharacterized protein LOC126765573 n=1 Tax=Bactrocera neohumeralis TaxID=98809 RepID=UPI00216664A8|nr:uncharacterized protein LOC126765573 [Bactrocera neohumeralis]